MLNPKMQNVIARYYMSWTQEDDSHIKVCFYGNFDEYHAQAERELFKVGLYATKRSYNKKTKQTCTIYKRGDSV